MILLKPSVEFESPVTHDLLRLIERAGRTCYKSEETREKQVDALEEHGECTDPDCNGWSPIPRDEADRRVTENFIRRIIKSGHHSVLEHASVSVRFICDRGVSHELVRHRLASFSQESTRYINYSKRGGCQFIIPPWVDFEEGDYEAGPYQGGGDHYPKLKNGEKWQYVEMECYGSEWTWFNSMLHSEEDYNHLLKKGWTPQQARSVLPNSAKTEVVMTSNFREWRHILKLRTSKAAHPQMREVMIMLLEKLKASQISVVFDDIEAE